jgi:two-component system, LytTR family, response regulator
MLKILIIDDDVRDREILQMLLQKYCSGDMTVAGVARSVDEAYELIHSLKPDLLFLDVELGAETGFDLLSRFSAFPFRVIFVTAYERYAMQAIKFNALDYVLKPIEINELVNAVQKIRATGRSPIDSELKNLLDTLAHPRRKSNRLAIPVLNGYRMVPVEEIMYCEAKKEYTYLYCSNQPPICSSVNLGVYEDLLQEYSFCRVHHSYLVNKEHVKQYIRGVGGELLIDNNTLIPISRRKKQEVMEWLRVIN